MGSFVSAITTASAGKGLIATIQSNWCSARIPVTSRAPDLPSPGEQTETLKPRLTKAFLKRIVLAVQAPVPVLAEVRLPSFPTRRTLFMVLPFVTCYRTFENTTEAACLKDLSILYTMKYLREKKKDTGEASSGF